MPSVDIDGLEIAYERAGGTGYRLTAPTAESAL